MKLGKKPAVADSRDLKFSAFATLALPTPPARFGHGTMYRDWGLLGNDQYGDCVFAGAGHETMLWKHLAGHPVTFTDQAVLSDYSAVTGFDPADPNTDQGTDMRAALSYRQKTGVVDANGVRHKIGAYVALTPGNWAELMQAVYVFGTVGVGIQFPRSAMDQFNNNQPWDVVAGSPIEGGHYVPAAGRSSLTTAGVITWGRRQGMTRAFYEAFNDESFCSISVEELRAGKNERGFDIAALTAALAALRP